ncbi:MAG: DNA polymerase IV, partial [Nitriliruptor sp.]
KLSETVGRRLRASGVAGRTITLKVRFDTFETVTRSSTLPAPTDRTRDVATIALDLLAGLRLERARVRLLGVGVSNLGEGDGARQLTLDTAAEEGPSPAVTARLADPRWERVERIADSVAERFQGVGVSYAALLDDQDDPAELAPRREDRGPHDHTSTSGQREEPDP